MRCTVRSQKVLVVAMLALLSGSAQAQNLEGAIAAYKANDFPEAAARFYEVLKFDTDEGNVAEAEYGLAQSFFKMGLYLPAVKYYENIIQAGNTHTYYFKAFEGILDAGDALNDDLKVPQVLDKAYGKSLRKLDSQVLQRIHYIIGELMYRQGKPKDARDFLNTVKKGNPAYAKAQYILGLMKLGVGIRTRAKPDREAAVKHFQNVLAELPANPRTRQDTELRRVATLAVGRVLYEDAAGMEEEDPARRVKLTEALRMYESIPRLSEHWPQALFERAWTHFLTNEYGQSLGLMHTLQSPAYEERYQPELHVLKAIVYYFNCHYDRTYRALEVFETEYKPLLEDLKKLNAEDRDAQLWYELLAKSTQPGRLKASNPPGEGLIPVRISREMANDPQWQKLDGMLAEIAKEKKKVVGSRAFGDGPLGEELVQLLDDAEKSFIRIAGRYAQRLSKKTEEDLQGFLNRGILVRLETSTAEQGWLEAGRDLQLNVVRRRLPRPFIPDDTFIYWNWRGEYWADEVGFYRYSIKSECIE